MIRKSSKTPHFPALAGLYARLAPPLVSTQAEPLKMPENEELEQMRRKLHQHLICPICGQPKIHYRLYGYRCHNPEHAERERDLERGQQDTLDTGAQLDAHYHDTAQLAALRKYQEDKNAR